MKKIRSLTEQFRHDVDIRTMQKLAALEKNAWWGQQTLQNFGKGIKKVFTKTPNTTPNITPNITPPKPITPPNNTNPSQPGFLQNLWNGVRDTTKNFASDAFQFTTGIKPRNYNQRQTADYVNKQTQNIIDSYGKLKGRVTINGKNMTRSRYARKKFRETAQKRYGIDAHLGEIIRDPQARAQYEAAVLKYNQEHLPGNIRGNASAVLNQGVKDITGASLHQWKNNPMGSAKDLGLRVWDAAGKPYQIADHNTTQMLKSNLRDQISDYGYSQAFNNALQHGTTGAMAGAGIGGIGGALLSDDDSLSGRLKSGLTGAALGAGVGGIGRGLYAGGKTIQNTQALKNLVQNNITHFNNAGDIITPNTAGHIINGILPQQWKDRLGVLNKFLYKNEGNIYDQLGPALQQLNNV